MPISPSGGINEKRLVRKGNLFESYPEAVHSIQKHVNDQAQGDQSQPVYPGDHEQEQIDCNGRVGMERMKADATAIRVVNGVGEQMININDHRSEHDQESPPPPLQIPRPGDQRRNSEMENHMNKRTHGVEETHTVENSVSALSL